jgi:hypothetical protein
MLRSIHIWLNGIIVTIQVKYRYYGKAEIRLRKTRDFVDTNSN